MNNYEYVVAGLPALCEDWSANAHLDVDEVISQIRALCSESDNALFDDFLKGFEEENFNASFYSRMLSSPRRFLSEYFRFDLCARNAKVRYLNDRLGRDADEGVFLEPDGEFEQEERLRAILYGEDLLEREKGLDSLYWEVISEINTFDYFNADALLGYIAKLKITDRWLKLDPETGRKMFRSLVDEIHGTFKGVEFNDNQ